MSISDRMAVLQGGVIQQIDRPETIFMEPANAFVVDFVGGCNWLDAEVDGQTLHLPGEASLTLDAPVAARRPVRLGVRAEDLRLVPGETAGFAARVLVRSYLGARTRLKVEHVASGTRLDVELASAPDLPGDGDMIRLGVAPGRLRLFAPDDGRRLA